MGVRPNTCAFYAHNISFLLRNRFGLHRRSAEWVCFRMLGLIEKNFKLRTPGVSVAEVVYDEWRKALSREYETL